MRPLTNNWR